MAPSRILIVENDPQFQKQLVQHVKEAFGGDVIGLSCGYEAVRLIREELFDVIVTALQLPGCGGMDLLLAARARDHEVAVVIIMMNEDRKIINRIEHNGGQIFCMPFYWAYLREQIKQALDARSKSWQVMKHRQGYSLQGNERYTPQNCLESH